jgi:rare lipoprotein A
MSKPISLSLAAILLAGIASAASSPEAVNPPVNSKPEASVPAAKSTAKTARTDRKAVVPSARKPKVQIGTASWYGKQFHGRLTANGETYDMFQFTAASRTLPMGTMVKVTNLRTGKWIVVKVNDRGPYVGNRIMDVSYGAAQMMGFRQRGLERVKLEVIDPETIGTTEIAQATP